jgi:hypothetical protein
MSIEAMKQALSKFEHLWEIGIDAEYKVELLPEIQALRQAIEQAEKQEPVAWMEDSIEFYAKDHPTNSCTIPLYTAPVKREWIGLTAEEIENIFEISPSEYTDPFALPRAIEAKLKERNT